MKQVYVCLIAVLLYNTVAAQTFEQTQVITTAVPSLQVPVDTRAGGMGEAGIAISADVNSVFVNRAKTAFATNGGGIGVNYTPWLRDVAPGMYLASLAGYTTIGEGQAVSASVRYFNLGNFELRDNSGTLLQTSHPNDLLLDLGYARALSDKLSLGIALRYIRSSLATGKVGSVSYKPGQAVAADISVFYNGTNEGGEGFTAGLVASNIGTKISYIDNATSKEFLPANLAVGAAYTWVPAEQHRITAAVDINKLMVPAMQPGDSIADYHNTTVLSSYGKAFSNKMYRYSFGLEYTFCNQFSARAGYLLEEKSNGNRSGLTVGIGLQYKICALNIAYFAPTGNGVTRNPVSNSLRFGVIFNLGKGE